MNKKTVATEMNEPKCKENACEYQPQIKREIKQARNPEETRYGQLWAEIEMPQKLKEKEIRK